MRVSDLWLKTKGNPEIMLIMQSTQELIYEGGYDDFPIEYEGEEIYSIEIEPYIKSDNTAGACWKIYVYDI